MLKKVSYTFLLIVLFISLSEILVRTWWPQDLISDILISDDDLCHRLKPNTIGVQNSKEFNTTININEFGLRGRPFTIAKDSNTFRILALGDSHTFGWGVNQENIFSERIENVFNISKENLNFEVLNCGVYGYGTGHQYIFLDKAGLELKPDLVILALDFLHDVRVNNSGYFHFKNELFIRGSKPCFTQKSRTITQYIPFSSYLRGHSHLFRFVGIEAINLYRLIFDKKKNEKSGLVENIDLNLTKKFIKKIHSELTIYNIPFVVVVLPEFNSYKLEARSNPNLIISLDMFINFLSTNNFNFLSLQDSFDQKIKSDDLTYKYSHHFNSTGHQFIAKKTTEYLISSNLIN